LTDPQAATTLWAWFGSTSPARPSWALP